MHIASSAAAAYTCPIVAVKREPVLLATMTGLTGGCREPVLLATIVDGWVSLYWLQWVGT